jgi:hypothetical protein
MGRVCSTHISQAKFMQNFRPENMQGMRYFKHVHVCCEIILKCILKG